MSTSFLDKDSDIQDSVLQFLNLSKFKTLAKERYGIDYKWFVERYDSENAMAAFYSLVLANYIIPEIKMGVDVLLFGKPRVQEKSLVSYLKRNTAKVVSKATPKFVKKRIDAAIEISPYMALLFAPYKIAISEWKELEKYNALLTLAELAAGNRPYFSPGLASIKPSMVLTPETIFVLIKMVEYGLLVQEEFVKLLLNFKGRIVDDRSVGIFGTSPLAADGIVGFFLNESLLTSHSNGNNYFLSSVENFLNKCGFEGFTLPNILAHQFLYSDVMGYPRKSIRLNFNTAGLSPVPFAVPFLGTKIYLTLKSKPSSTTKYKENPTLGYDPENIIGAVDVSKNPFFPPVTPPVTPPTDPVTPPVDPVTPPTDPVTPPVDPVTPPTDPVTPPVDPSLEFIDSAIDYISEFISKLSEVVGLEGIRRASMIDSLLRNDMDMIKLRYSFVLYAEKVKELGYIAPEDFIQATSQLKSECFDGIINIPYIDGKSFVELLTEWESQGNRVENSIDPMVDDRHVSIPLYKRLQYTLMSLMGYKYASAFLADTGPFRVSESLTQVKQMWDDLGTEDKQNIVEHFKSIISGYVSTYGKSGSIALTENAIFGGMFTKQYIDSARFELFENPWEIVEEEKSGIFRYSYLLTDGIYPTNAFIQQYFAPVAPPVTEPEQPVVPPTDNNNQQMLMELSNFAQALIGDQTNAGLVGRIIASAFSILMQRIFTNNIVGGVLQFEGVSVEVTNPETMGAQMQALTEKVLSLLVSIPESSPMHVNFSHIKQMLMNGMENQEQLSALVTDTAENVYRVGGNINTAAYTIFNNVLALNVIGNSMAGVDPTSNAVDISRILLGTTIASMNDIDPATVVSSLYPVYEFKNSTNSNGV